MVYLKGIRIQFTAKDLWLWQRNGNCFCLFINIVVNIPKISIPRFNGYIIAEYILALCKGNTDTPQLPICFHGTHFCRDGFLCGKLSNVFKPQLGAFRLMMEGIRNSKPHSTGYC